ncbi:EAL and HDOD domain-containing protein [Desulfohalovibrio reitneri]|uniref:EAL and HDOD domain-containing protein n=1 Tax=Desulfohalovibrio reitneri TaxID=1307759 RepID=UPI0004A735C5|nr:HDOD domain-containing protein [Desulfohalovibrio reitneri]
MTAEHDAEINYEPVFVARQPIFDLDERIWGYELLYRHCGDAVAAQLPDPDTATARVIADGFDAALPSIAAGRKVLINFTERMLLEGAAYALPKEHYVVEILEDVPPTPDILTALEELQKTGYAVALDDYTGQESAHPLLPYADLIKVDVLGLSTEEIGRLAGRLAPYGRPLLAEKVEDARTLDHARKLGFTLFQGFHFSRPEIIPGRKVSAGATAKFQLLQEFTGKDYDTQRLGEIISGDISLSYRLLQHLNSAHFGLRSEVRSIQHAITLLGYRALRKWLMVVIISDVAPSTKAEELAFTALLRARFLERLAETLGRPETRPDTMFLLGMLSRLDALLGRSMEELVETMPLEEQVREALLGRECRLRSHLDLIESLEHGDWPSALRKLEEHGLSREQAAGIHAEASAWAGQIMGAAMEMKAA